MAPIKISIPTNFINSMTQFMSVIDKTQVLTNQINTTLARGIRIAPSTISPQQVSARIPGLMNQFPSLFHKMQSTLVRFIDRLILMLGTGIRSFVQSIVIPERIFSGLNRILKLAGSMSAGRFAMLFRFGGVPGAVVEVIKWIYDKAIQLLEKVQKDKIQSLVMGTSVGGLRAYRTAFWMLPEDPMFVNIMSSLRGYGISAQALQIFGTLKVSRTIDTVEQMVQVLIRAQEYLKLFPRQETQAAREFGIPLGPATIRALMDPRISHEELIRVAKRELGLRGPLGLTEKQEADLLEFLNTKEILIEGGKAFFLKKLVSSGLAGALTDLSNNLTNWLKSFEKSNDKTQKSSFPSSKSNKSSSLIPTFKKQIVDLNNFMREKGRSFEDQLARLTGTIGDVSFISSAAAAEGGGRIGGLAGRIRGRTYAGRRAGIRGTGDLGPVGPSRLGPAVGAGNIEKELNINGGEWDAYRQGLADIESSGGRYGLTGGSSGRFSGAYQFGANEIADTARQLGEPVPTRQQYLSDPAMQERYLSQYTYAHHQQLMQNPTYRAMSPREKLGILGYAHNQGVGGALRYLQTGQAGSDAFGTSGTAYPKSIQRRLQQLDQGQRVTSPSLAPAVIPNVPAAPVRTFIPPDIPSGMGPMVADRLKTEGVTLPAAIDAKIRKGEQLTVGDLQSIPKDQLEKTNTLVIGMNRPPLYKDAPVPVPQQPEITPVRTGTGQGLFDPAPITQRNFLRDSTGAIINPQVFAQAEQLARTGNVQGVYRFMQSQGVKVDYNYCGDFVGAVVKAQGGRPPPGYPVATSWMNYGTPVRPGEERPGDIAILSRGYSPGTTGGHVGMVGSRGAVGDGKFQFFGANTTEEHIASEYGYTFRRPPQVTPVPSEVPLNYTPRPKLLDPTLLDAGSPFDPTPEAERGAKSKPKEEPTKDDPPQHPEEKHGSLTHPALKEAKLNNRSDAKAEIKWNGSAGSSLSDTQTASPTRRRGTPVNDDWTKQKLAALSFSNKPDSHEEKPDPIPVNALAFTRAIGRTETGFDKTEAYKESYNQLTGKHANSNMLRLKKAGQDPSRGADYGYFQMNQEQVDDAVNRLGMSRDMAQHLTGGPHHDSTLEQQIGATSEYLKRRWPIEYKDLIEKNDYQKLLHATRSTWFGLADPPKGRPKDAMAEFNRVRDAARVNAAAVMGM